MFIGERKKDGGVKFVNKRTKCVVSEEREHGGARARRKKSLLRASARERMEESDRERERNRDEG